MVATIEPAGNSDLSTLSSKIEVTIDNLDLSFRAAPVEGGGMGPTVASVMGNGLRWMVESVDTDEGQAMVWSAGNRTLRFDKR